MFRKSLSFVVAALGVSLLVGAQVESRAQGIYANGFAMNGSTPAFQVWTMGWLQAGKPAAGSIAVKNGTTAFSGTISALNFTKDATGDRSVVTGLGRSSTGKPVIIELTLFCRADGASFVSTKVTDWFTKGLVYTSDSLVARNATIGAPTTGLLVKGAASITR